MPPITCRVTLNIEPRSTPMTAPQSSRSILWNMQSFLTPALLIRISTGPIASSTSRTPCAQGVVIAHIPFKRPGCPCYPQMPWLAWPRQDGLRPRTHQHSARAFAAAAPKPLNAAGHKRGSGFGRSFALSFLWCFDAFGKISRHAPAAGRCLDRHRCKASPTRAEFSSRRHGMQ